MTATGTTVFKHLEKLVSQQQRESTTKELYQRLHYYIIGLCREQHKLEDIRTNGDCCFNHIIGLPQKDGQDKPLYDYEQIVFVNLLDNSNYKHLWSSLLKYWDLSCIITTISEKSEKSLRVPIFFI